MRQSLLVGGLFSLSTSVIAAIVAQGCAGGGARSGSFESEDDAGVDAGTVTSINGNLPGDDAGSVIPPPTPTPGDDAATSTQTCVHNTDCTSPNLCVGNNGLECAGGFCVPTGKPMNCDDGIACTLDVCNASTNSCAHTPSDSACPDGEYCDPTLNCVQTLPCTPGDSVCDRLDLTACDGLWSCDATKLYCTHAPAPCPARANAVTSCAPAGSDGGEPVDAGAVSVQCSWTCQAGFVDLNGNLDAPVVEGADGSTGSDGCECQIVGLQSDGGAPFDAPDLGFVDSNCDGIDGTIADAIFVDTASGASGNPGTMAAPLKTIGDGITAAANANPKKSVYISAGYYPETISLSSGVSLYGGYSAANKWQRSTANTTILASGTSVGLTAVQIATATEVQLLTIQSQNPASGVDLNGDGNNGVGVLVLQSSATVTLRGCTINATSGSPGSDGQTGGAAAAAAPEVRPRGARSEGAVTGVSRGRTAGPAGPR